MLSENIRSLRKAKGLSQEELAVKLNVVRQTVSKWENQTSVPDSQLLISMAEIFEVSVSTLLGETLTEEKSEDLKIISEKLEVINLQLANRNESRRKALHVFFFIFGIILVIVLVAFYFFSRNYQNWNSSDPESIVVKTGLHSLEWLFVRVSPFLLMGSGLGYFFTRSKK